MIESIRMVNFKNISDATVNFKSKISGIYGPNGSGKTTVIEAINLLKCFFGMNKDYEIGHYDDEKLLDYIKKETTTSEISMEILDSKYIFKLGIVFQKNDSGEVNVIKEYIYHKENNSRLVYKNIFTLDNGPDNFLPIITLNSNKNDAFEYFRKNLFEKNKTSLQSIIKQFGNFKSFLLILSNEYSKFKETNPINEELEELLKIWKKLEMSLGKLDIITLKDQAISNLEIAIPIFSNAHESTKTIFLNKKENLYTKEEYEIINSSVNNINKLFPLFIHNATIKCEGRLAYKEEGEETYSVNIYIIKNNIKINIYNESSGTIKLFVILSSLMGILKDENAVLVVDELDVHIFEYLLAFILSKIPEYIKGQLIFTSHNLLPMEKLDRNSIIISTVSKGENNSEEINYTFFKGKISQTTNLRLKYLRSQYTWTEENITPLFINESKVEKILREIGD